MPRKKKDGSSVHFYLDNGLHRRLEEYCEKTGLSKTTAVERMIKTELDLHDKAANESVLSPVSIKGIESE